jgi:DNA primase
VYIAYDRDEAGNNAAAKLAEELMQMGIECFRVLFPKDMDANAYALKVQPAAKSLGVLLNKAEWLGKGQRPEPRALEPVIEAAPEPGTSQSQASSHCQQRQKQQLKKKSSKLLQSQPPPHPSPPRSKNRFFP